MIRIAAKKIEMGLPFSTSGNRWLAAVPRRTHVVLSTICT